VPYKGSAPALQDLIGGNIEMTVDTLGSLLPQHQAGRVRILAVASDKRLDQASDIPTVAESADLDKPFVAMLWNVVAAPRGTPPAVMQRLAEATQRTMNDPELRRRLAAQAMFVDLHVGQAASVAFVKAERAKWQPIVATLGGLSGG
jgi:tripartite-type tricarboxylate transporter receptor subunit TctC